MSPQHGGKPSVRRRLVSGAAAAAAALAVASPVSAYWFGRSDAPADLRADIGAVLQAAKVSSRTTATAVTITITAPQDQPPGVTYTVVRVTNRGEDTVCAGTAPLTCTDPVDRPGTAVSYTVVSSLTGHGKATTALDVVTARAPRPTRSPTVPDDDHRPAPPAPEQERSSQRPSISVVVAAARPTPTPSPSPSSPSPSPSPSTPSPTGSPSPSPPTSPSPSPSDSPTTSTTPASSASGTTTGPTLSTTSTAPAAGAVAGADSTGTRRP